MRRTYFAILLLLSGCAAYKELSPKPPVQPFEQGYIELKNNKENFKLEKDSKYYMKFPGPEQQNMVLVLSARIKPILGSTLASAFDNGAPADARVRDEMPESDSLLVYGLDMRFPVFYWVIDTVRYDAELAMHYRYVPRWRFEFENKFAVLRDLLAKNRIDPAVYNAIVPDYSFRGIDCAKEVGLIEIKNGKLDKVKTDMQELARLFPADIASKHDTAYDNYLLLQSDLDAEMTLQHNYAALLRVVDREQATRGNPGAFMSASQVFFDFFATQGKQRPAVVERVRSMLTDHLPSAESYYSGLLRSKTDYTPFTPKPPLETLTNLYEACEATPSASFRAMAAFAARYNIESAALLSARAKLDDLEHRAQRETGWNTDAIYADMISRAGDVRAAIPQSQLEQYEGGAGVACGRALTTEISRETAEVSALQSLYQRGAADFAQINAGAWASAEAQLREMATATEFESAPAAMAERQLIASRLDNEMFTRIKDGTVRRVDAFVSRNTPVIDDVPGLYRDSAFVPLYTLTFNPGGAAQLAAQKREIDDYIAQARHVRFPLAAIRLLYPEFVRNPADHGVDRARAIVAHGKEYTGTEKDVLSMVSECDPTVAKWISKPKDYRKVYALPVTSMPEGKNEYMFRVRLQIPSDAEFPVFDVNIKLPRDVAERAGQEAWFSSITINKKPIKNEGRFRITAPTAENGYESLITPVEMDKQGANVLEVQFMYPGLRVFEISAMAQVPIIRKN